MQWHLLVNIIYYMIDGSIDAMASIGKYYYHMIDGSINAMASIKNDAFKKFSS